MPADLTLGRQCSWDVSMGAMTQWGRPLGAKRLITPHSSGVTQGRASVHCTPRGQEPGGRGAPDRTRASPTAPWIFCRDSTHKMLEWEPVKETGIEPKA